MPQIETAAAQLDSRVLLRALRALRKGDFTVRLPSDLSGIDGELAEAFNEVVELNHNLAGELDRIGRVVGKEGQIGERGRLPSARGCWSECIASVNAMIGDLVQPTTEVARVIGAVAKGDLSQSMQLEIEGRPLRGEFLRIGKVVNTMVGQLSSFASR
jgi:methyl-accepting chemotaxis protein